MGAKVVVKIGLIQQELQFEMVMGVDEGRALIERASDMADEAGVDVACRLDLQTGIVRKAIKEAFLDSLEFEFHDELAVMLPKDPS